MPILLLTLILTSFTGCQQPDNGFSRRDDRLERVFRRMRATYADLSSGRFVSLAHLELPEEGRLFRVVGPDGREGDRPQPAICVLHDRNGVGAGGLEAHLSTDDDVLLLDGHRSETLALMHDWRDYALLLVSVYGPPDGVVLEFTVRGGGGDARPGWTRTLFARSGWNLFRFDLAEIGAAVDLADVCSMAWRAPEIAAPIDLFFDDVILADNKRHVLGEGAGIGEMYAFTQGRRIHVGARERFELVFSDGVIAGCYADGHENLTVRSGLGPWPLPLGEDWHLQRQTPPTYDDPRLFSHWGPHVAATQRLEESTPFRVVVVGEWRFVGGSDVGAYDMQANKRPGHTWRYTVYASGAVYIRATSEAPSTGWQASRVGYAVALDGQRGFRRVASPPTEVGKTIIPLVLLSRPGPRLADLLWTMTPTAAAMKQLMVASDDERRLAVIVGDLEATETVTTAHLLRFWPRDIDAVPEAESLAADPHNPAKIAASAGRLITNAAGDLNQDGYNEAEGCYELEPDGRVLRFEFDPGGRLRHEPVFRVRETAGKRCWLYANGRIVQTRGRDRDDRLLFMIPRVVTMPLVVEVNIAAEP